ncbi:MAG: OmpA family protein [Bacteroidia bacterium]|nr:OmpA family protein [Bacteroidia bacterium]
MKKKVFIAALAGIVSLNAGAQTMDKPWNLGVYGGSYQYNGDLGNTFFNYNKAFYGNLGLGVSRYANEAFDLALGLTQGHDGAYFESARAKSFNGKVLQANLSLRYKIVQKDGAKFVPFLHFGGGVANYNNITDNGLSTSKGTDLNITGGLGLRYAVNDWFNLEYVGTLLYSGKDSRDFESSYGTGKGFNDGWLINQIGVSFNLGAAADEDKDGVSDKKDKCPGTPVGIIVGKDGCPVDRDADGVLNEVDACPDVKGLAAINGCPDTDDDGIEDSKDDCPTEKGLTQFNGCPDTDNDGIKNSEDACPKVKGLAAFKGCPDTDGDGVEDKYDKCPTVKGLLTLKGCPDGDGDGIADNEDKCPTVAGIAVNKGCPEVKKEVLAVFEKALQGIQFETGKSIIKKTSFGILDNVVTIMKENTDYKLDIAGHTDNKGKADENLTLSNDRALAVQKYLTNKGVDASRLTAKGFGDTVPVADNTTKEGCAKNRRVEFKVIF